MRGRADAATLLERALRADAGAAGVTVTRYDATATRWASATFTGARHEVTLGGVRSAAADAWVATLDEADLPLRGQLVADLIVRDTIRQGDGFTVRVEVLTVEER